MNIHISIQTSYVFNRMENPKQEHMQIKKQRQRSSTAAFREQETPMRSLTHARLRIRQHGAALGARYRFPTGFACKPYGYIYIYIVILVASLEQGRVCN